MSDGEPQSVAHFSGLQKVGRVINPAVNRHSVRKSNLAKI